ncbi:ABC transporter permease [Halarsenatibacter silvermanii]|uniref:Putative ABC transport system permease protein n=1 Tax=Halarsenatibacter silvermanii TaxID=321763 RepID=A0A1G9LUB7_9FIRM|nr:FtsX-like permease family protein [Halarsenatibacter silvermanii]SDL65404.1 putative ABC transport system permease protein [Halarsenatibacter silvermanii]
MYPLRLAFRNLFRRKQRTLLASGVLALAVFIFLVIDSFMLGMMELSFGNLIDFETAHLQLARKDFFEEEEYLSLDEVFVFDRKMRDELAREKAVESFTPLIEFQAEIIAGREDFPVRTTAVEPDSFSEVMRVPEYLVEGEFLKPGDRGAVIGSDLAELMNLEKGDIYTLHFRDAAGAYNVMQGEVRGIISTPSPRLNRNTVLVSREYGKTAAGVADKAVSQVKVRLSDRELAEAAARRLDKNMGAEISARYYRETSDILEAMESWIRLENFVILGLILVVGAIGIVNVVVLSALERMEEIGLMKAMGLSEKQIVGVFAMEAAGIGIIGGILGCVSGAAAVALLAEFGLDLEIFYGEGVHGLGIPVLERLYGVWNPRAFIFVFIFVVLLAVVISLIPSIWAARQDPIEAIRGG